MMRTDPDDAARSRSVDRRPSTVDRRSTFYELELAVQVRRAKLLVGSDAAANDVVHEAFTAMYERWDSIREPGPT